MSKPKKLRRILKAAKMGKPYAMYQLGLYWQLGRMGEPDMEQAAAWMAAAADCGSNAAAEWLRDYAFDDSAAVQADA